MRGVDLRGPRDSGENARQTLGQRHDRQNRRKPWSPGKHAGVADEQAVYPGLEISVDDLSDCSRASRMGALGFGNGDGRSPYTGTL